MALCVRVQAAKIQFDWFPLRVGLGMEDLGFMPHPDLLQGFKRRVCVAFVCVCVLRLCVLRGPS